MTDQPPTDIELASAYLDGEATPEERARVEADPGLTAQVEELRTVADTVDRGFTPLTEAQAAPQRRRAIQVGREAPLAPPAPSRRRTWLPPPVAAAAVIIVIALVGAWLLASAGGNSSDDNASSSGSSGARTESASTGATTTGSATPAGGATDRLPDLGSFDTQAALTAALDQVDVTSLEDDNTATTPPKETGQTSAAINRCSATVQAGQPELGDRLAVATATLDGRLVYVFSNPVNGKEPPRTQLTVSDAETCRALFAIQR